MKGIGKGGLIINLANTGGNKWREWGDVRQTKNGIRLRLPLSKLGGRKGQDREVGLQVQEEDQGLEVYHSVQGTYEGLNRGEDEG